MMPGALPDHLREPRPGEDGEVAAGPDQAGDDQDAYNRPQRPPEPCARAKKEEEELRRPPSRHQILLPIRRGEA